MKYIGYSTRWGAVGLRDYKLPKSLKPWEVLVDVNYLGLNPLDIKLKSVAMVPIGWQVGKDFSGTIVDRGNELKGVWAPGDRVCGGSLSPVGTLGTQAVLDVRTNAVLRPPPHMDDQEAAAFPLTFGTAWDMLASLRKGGGKVLVLGGASNVGTYAIQLAKHLYGSDTVVATCSAASAGYVRSIGADETVDYTAGDVSGQLVDLGIKFDRIVDTVGGYDALRVWPAILKPFSEGGVYVTNAGDVAPSGSYKEALVYPTLMTLPYAATRLLFGRWLGINYQLVAANAKWVPQAHDFLQHFPLKVRIDSVYPWDEFQAAWDRLESMQARGKVLISTKAP